MKFISLAFVLVCLLNSAYSQTYFPVKIGNQWTYANGTITKTIAFVDTQRINEKLYFGLAVDENPPVYWFRVLGQQVFIRTSDSDTEYLIYDFSANRGTSQSGPPADCEFGGEIVLHSKTDSIATPKGIFTEVFQFIHNPPCSDAGLLNEWFAPEIGRVKFIENNIAGAKTFLLVDSTIPTSVGERDGSNTPRSFHLSQNHPNPFNPSTTISYAIPHAGFVTLKIYDLRGKELRTLVSEFQRADTYSVDFDASGLPSGIYFYSLRVGLNLRASKKLLLLK